MQLRRCQLWIDLPRKPHPVGGDAGGCLCRCPIIPIYPHPHSSPLHRRGQGGEKSAFIVFPAHDEKCECRSPHAGEGYVCLCEKELSCSITTE